MVTPRHDRERDQRSAASRSIQLHPELARVAVLYQSLIQDHLSGRIDSNTATVRARELVARDDNGVRWTINPRDGGWLREDRNGTWVPAEPPTSGIAQLSPWELSQTRNPDDSISYQAVDHPGTGSSLAGSTYRRDRRRPTRRTFERPRWLYPGLMALAVILASYVLLVSCSDPGPLAVGPGPTVPAGR